MSVGSDSDFPSAITFKTSTGSTYNSIFMDYTDYPAAAEKANGYCSPLGPEYGTCWLLIEKSEFDRAFPPYGESDGATQRADNPINKPIDVTFYGRNSVTIKGLYLIEANKVTPGFVGGVYLVELRDKRYLIDKFSPLHHEYNVRCAGWSREQGVDEHAVADNGLPYYTYSLMVDSSGNRAAWTWEAILQSVWNQTGVTGGPDPAISYELIGVNSWPGFPSGFSVPSLYPENFRFYGVSAWRAIHQVLECLGLTTNYDPQAGTFSIVHLGTKQANISGLIVEAGNGSYDSQSRRSDIAVYPETIDCYSRAINKHLGSENWSGKTSKTFPQLNTDTDQVFSFGSAIPPSAKRPTPISNTRIALWDNMPFVYTFGGTGDQYNGTDLRSRGEQMRDQWLAEQDNSNYNYRLTFEGIYPAFTTGPEVRAIWWRNFGKAQTVVIATNAMPTAEDAMLGRNPTLSAPSHDWATQPAYPPLMQWVFQTGAQTDAMKTAGVLPGTIVIWDLESSAEPYATPQPDSSSIWIRQAVPYAADVPALNGYALARLAGSFSVSGASPDVRPLFITDVSNSQSGSAIAVKNWQHSGGASPRKYKVSCNLWSGGSTYDTGPFDIYFDGVIEGVNLPNVETGDYVSYRIGYDGHLVTADGLDSPLGFLQPISSAMTGALIPHGWALADSSANASGNGGSGDNYADGKYIVGDADNSTGGRDHFAVGGNDTVVQSGTGETLSLITVVDGSGFGGVFEIDVPINPKFHNVRFIERIDNSVP